VPRKFLARSFASTLALFLSLGTIALPASTVAATKSSGIQISKVGTRAFEDLATCLASYKKPVLDVFYLVDFSGSLEYTDPKYVRKDVLGSSVQELKSFANEGVEVNYAASLFATDVQRVQGWTNHWGTPEGDWGSKCTWVGALASASGSTGGTSTSAWMSHLRMLFTPGGPEKVPVIAAVVGESH
jgi:hypothetical protein